MILHQEQAQLEAKWPSSLLLLLLALPLTTMLKLKVRLATTKGMSSSKGTTPLAKRTSMERIALPLLRVRIITSIKASPQLRIAQNLVRLVNGSHLLFGFFLGITLLMRLIRMVLLRGLAVC